MQKVHQAFVVMLLVTGSWTAHAQAAAVPTDPVHPDFTPWPAPASAVLDSTLSTTAAHIGPAADAVEAIPTPSAMSLGAGGLAILAGTRLFRRIRLAA